MTDVIEIIPAEANSKSTFETIEEIELFREQFTETVSPIQDKWVEARRLSEVEARHRSLR